LGSIAAFWLYYWLLSQIDVTKAMMIAFVTPLVAVFIGSYYGEIIDRRTFAGALLVLLSVLVIVLTPMISKRRSSAA
jgi:drug/metabolite transporter (DMT)-like permease